MLSTRNRRINKLPLPPDIGGASPTRGDASGSHVGFYRLQFHFSDESKAASSGHAPAATRWRRQVATRQYRRRPRPSVGDVTISPAFTSDDWYRHHQPLAI